MDFHFAPLLEEIDTNEDFGLSDTDNSDDEDSIKSIQDLKVHYNSNLMTINRIKFIHCKVFKIEDNQRDVN